MDKITNIETAVFGGGCFWCTEAVFKMLKGVISVAPGYSGGATDSTRSARSPQEPLDRAPTYEEVCSGNTGYVEVIQIEYNPVEISFDKLLTVFFGSHDPTTKNRQGNDMGTQYRSVIFYTTEEQRQTASKFIDDINKSNPDGQPVVTELEPLKTFYPAESYHQDYYTKNKGDPYCELIINPKLQKVQEKFTELLKDN